MQCLWFWWNFLEACQCITVVEMPKLEGGLYLKMGSMGRKRSSSSQFHTEHKDEKCVISTLENSPQ